MTTFIGEYSAKLDDKGRLVLPSALKAQLPAESEMCFVLKKDMFADCIEMYPIGEWERITSELRARLDDFNQEHKMFFRTFTRNTFPARPDAKIGRFNVAKELLDMIGVTKEVVFCGCDYKIEIWAKEKFEASALSNEEFIAIAGRLPEKR